MADNEMSNDAPKQTAQAHDDQSGAQNGLPGALRAMAGARSDADARVMHLAAEEIERLRAEVVRLEQDLDSGISVMSQDQTRGKSPMPSENQTADDLKPGDRILIEAEVNEIGVNKRQPLVGVAFRYGTKITYSSVPVQLIRKAP